MNKLSSALSLMAVSTSVASQQVYITTQDTPYVVPYTQSSSNDLDRRVYEANRYIHGNGNTYHPESRYAPSYQQHHRQQGTQPNVRVQIGIPAPGVRVWVSN